MKKWFMCVSVFALLAIASTGCAPKTSPSAGADTSGPSETAPTGTSAVTSTATSENTAAPKPTHDFSKLILPDRQIPETFSSKSEEIEYMFEYYMDAVPSITELPDYDPVGYPGIKAIYYDGLKNNGVQTKIFAYIGFPEGASADKPVPAVVLLHGGGGYAFPQWVKIWNQKGYAAIAMCNTGYIPKEPGNPDFYSGSSWTRVIPPEEKKNDPRVLIPDNDSMNSYKRDVSRQWMYHAVGSVIMANNLLRADERVDSSKIGITGISWGGVITSIAMGYDTRFAFNIPIYGCAHLGESMTWMKNCFTPGAVELWDATKRLDKVKSPILWLCWAGDTAFSINTNNASYLDTIDKSIFSMRMNMGHSHDLGWIPFESYRFADSIIKGGQPMTTIKEHPTAEMGRDVSLKADIPEDTTRISAICYYIDSELSYTSDSNMTQQWRRADCTVDKETGSITVRLPEDAHSYYIEITSTCAQGSYVTSSEFITVE